MQVEGITVIHPQENLGVSSLPVSAPTTSHARNWHARAWSGVLLSLVYIALLYLASAHQTPSWWAVLPLLAPLAWGLGLVVGQRSMATGKAVWFWPCLFLALLIAAIAWLAQQTSYTVLSPFHVRLLYFLQETVLLWLMTGMFAMSLLPGRTPLCTAMATVVHARMTPRVAWYTRQVTMVWAIWLGVLWLASLLLFVIAPSQIWALFSCVISPALMLALFGAEALMRRFFLPREDRPSLAATWQSARSVNWADTFRNPARTAGEHDDHPA